MRLFLFLILSCLLIACSGSSNPEPQPSPTPSSNKDTLNTPPTPPKPEGPTTDQPTLEISPELLKKYPTADGIKAYFMLLPQQYLGLSTEERTQILNAKKGEEVELSAGDKAELVTLDPKNGFLEYYNLSGRDFGDERVEITYWQRSGKNALVAVNTNLAGDYGLESELKLLELNEDGNGWREVSSEYLPSYQVKDILSSPKLTEKTGNEFPVMGYQLPKNGKNIKAYCNFELMTELYWSELQGKFDILVDSFTLVWENDNFRKAE